MNSFRKAIRANVKRVGGSPVRAIRASLHPDLQAAHSPRLRRGVASAWDFEESATHEWITLPPSRLVPSHGWIGTRECPGYRVANVIAKLDQLPGIDSPQLHVDFILLDRNGDPCDNHSGPCPAVTRSDRPEQRRRFVRLAAELLRHALVDAEDLCVAHPALAVLREQGVGPAALKTAAQRLDAASPEAAVAAALADLLPRVLGEAPARRLMADAAQRLPGQREAAASDPAAAHAAAGAPSAALADEACRVVQAVGRRAARTWLGALAGCELVPSAALFDLEE